MIYKIYVSLIIILFPANLILGELKLTQFPVEIFESPDTKALFFSAKRGKDVNYALLIIAPSPNANLEIGTITYKADVSEWIVEIVRDDRLHKLDFKMSSINFFANELFSIKYDLSTIITENGQDLSVQEITLRTNKLLGRGYDPGT
ncbi:MAG: hypothetical protein ACFE0O_14830 [Opitutales bacterium]